MDQGVLVTEEIEAGRRLALAFNDYAPVKAAFWLKEGDSPQKYFYISSNRINSNNFDLAYGEVLRISSSMPSLYLNPMRTKVIAGDMPYARAAEELNHRFPDPLGHMLGSCMFGDSYIDYAYVYPPLAPRQDADSTKVEAAAR